ncbi:MAG: sulfite exporter TauE/SafE family protein [Dehalococcoidia bacterium]|nr:sulfite exporter TauE/SafE family protein [Dehalococcoidia bacterium]
MGPVEALALVAIGFAIGTYATAIGAGGGFLIAPLLLIRYPDADPVAITTASLTVVFASALASSAVMARERLVDLPVVAAMLVVAVPAALLGGLVTDLVPRALFAAGFAVLLGCIGAYLVWRPVAGVAETAGNAWQRTRTDRAGNRYSYRIPIFPSIVPNAGASFLGALAGIGGGPIGIPIMTRLMHIPHTIATTSMHALIVAQSGVVVAMHLALSHGGDPGRDVPWLAVGVVLGSPAGRLVRRRLGEGPLTRLLALGLFFIAVRTAVDVF